MKLLVCGGRKFARISPYMLSAARKKALAEKALLNRTLDDFLAEHEVSKLISGMAEGADYAAYLWALKNNIPVAQYPALWHKYGKAAGSMRNVQMLEEGKPDVVIAFPGGVGTAHMCKIAEANNVKVLRISDLR